MTWTASAVNADNPAAPPDGAYTWICSTYSGDLCPLVDALNSPDSPSIMFTMSTFSVDTYTLVATFSLTDPNYQLPGGAAVQEVQFITTNSGR